MAEPEAVNASLAVDSRETAKTTEKRKLPTTV
jgi:hypothetical protein